MIYIIAGTNRPGSRSLQVAQFVSKMYAQKGAKVEILDLAQIPICDLNGSQYSEPPESIKKEVEKINHSSGVVVVCPEYNGSYPGALKYFIDHWQYPLSFEHRPIAFVGLGGRFGGLRPVEHLQGVFGYRNAFIYPERVFLSNIFQILKEGSLTDPVAVELLDKQTDGFIRFIRALKTEGLSAEAKV